jgi:hypothetical protein
MIDHVMMMKRNRGFTSHTVYEDFVFFYVVLDAGSHLNVFPMTFSKTFAEGSLMYTRTVHHGDKGHW